VRYFQYQEYLKTAADRDVVEGWRLRAEIMRLNAAFFVMYAIEFLCMCTAKLMALDLMSDFAAPLGSNARRLWILGGRIVMAVVVLGNAVGVAANIAAAVYFEQAAAYFTTASAYGANSTAAIEYSLSAQQDARRAFVYVFQFYCEALLLMLIIAAFVVVGIMSVRRFSSALAVLDTAGPDIAAAMMLRGTAIPAAKALGRKLRREVVITTVFLFLASLLRLVSSTIHMVSIVFYAENYANGDCPGSDPCNTSCFNVYALIFRWYSNTPDFAATAVLISSPLALLVALWGMTSKRALQSMKSNRQVPLKALAVVGNAPA
jgi:hypothetical protein